MVSDAQMQSQLERLPPGHPSSPWDAEGRRRPPPPWLAELELPLPGHWPGAQDGSTASENFEKNDAADGTIGAVSHVIVSAGGQRAGQANPSSPARPPHFPGL